VRHFQGYIAAAHGDLYYGIYIPRFCKVCAYQNQLWNLPEGSYHSGDAPPFLRINVNEQCPSFFPKAMSSAYEEHYFALYGGEFGAWNSCWHLEVWERTPQIVP